MKYRTLGRTGLSVSELSLGTVALGTKYGFQLPGEPVRLSETEVIRLLDDATDAGINLFDTAPAYGDSERLLGRALGHRADCIIATKVSVPRDEGGRVIRGPALRRSIEASLEHSRRTLCRDALDILQVHNATLDAILESEVAEILVDAQRAGKVRFLGASVYTEAEALAAVRARCFDMIQVPYNVLDQRMVRRVFPAAARAGVGVVVRSVLLKGVLSTRAHWLPPELLELQRAAEQVREAWATPWHSLPGVALRFCCSSAQVAAVLVGVRSIQELRQAVAATREGPLSGDLLAVTPHLAVADERLLNPSSWPIA